MRKKAVNGTQKRDGKKNRNFSRNVKWRQKRDGNRDSNRNVHGKRERGVRDQWMIIALVVLDYCLWCDCLVLTDRDGYQCNPSYRITFYDQLCSYFP